MERELGKSLFLDFLLFSFLTRGRVIFAGPVMSLAGFLSPLDSQSLYHSYSPDLLSFGFPRINLKHGTSF